MVLSLSVRAFANLLRMVLGESERRMWEHGLGSDFDIFCVGLRRDMMRLAGAFGREKLACLREKGFFQGQRRGSIQILA